MTVRNDVTVDFTLSPRIIEVASPSTEITIQDLYDTLREIEDDVWNLNYPLLINGLRTAGKQTLSPTKQVGITLTLNNALLKFEDRLGPNYEIMTVSDGNLVAVDDGAPPVFIEPIEPSSFTVVKTESDVSAGLIQRTELEEIHAIHVNRMITDPDTGKINIYDENDVLLFVGDIWEDKDGTQIYRGTGTDRRDKLVKQ